MSTVQQVPGIDRPICRSTISAFPAGWSSRTASSSARRRRQFGTSIRGKIIYVLEGSLEYAIDGEQPKTYSAGEALMVPAETVHAVRNVGTGRAAELATYVVEKRKPFLVVVE
jgi:uncharacterized protein YaiE (UPF0345 family)